jgi:HD-GYP domain-containing protein (c-di-GMP phosphodiesterase class II)
MYDREALAVVSALKFAPSACRYHDGTTVFFDADLRAARGFVPAGILENSCRDPISIHGRKRLSQSPGTSAMADTQVLLNKISALRQRLEQAQGLADSAAAALLKKTDAPPRDAFLVLENKIASGNRQTAMLTETLPPRAGDARLPVRLTARASRLLQKGRELLDPLRRLNEEPILRAEPPLVQRHLEIASLIDAVLRGVQHFPETPSVQIRLCEGLEAMLGVASDRLTALSEGVSQRQRRAASLAKLVEILRRLADEQPFDVRGLTELGDRVLTDAQEGQPLHFLVEPVDQAARFVAAHCLTVAQVAARLVRADPDWRGRALEVVLAALVHDVGMLVIPAETFQSTGPLDDEQRRVLERHVYMGADRIARMVPNSAWLVEATQGHHERIDGTGYPLGLRDLQVGPLARFLAVCDVYAAMCCARPHRVALETRTALADTLLLAEQGTLDRFQAERLLQLTFYPVGQVVELADGAVGLVVATHPGRRDLNGLARPVVALLNDSQGHPLPVPQHLDLAECEGRSILRSLPARERRQVLDQRYPEWL